MRLNETLAISSIEHFLTPSEIERVIALVDDHKAGVPDALWRATGRAKSVHTVPGLSREATMAAYEPAGRVELEPVPTGVRDILGEAVERWLPALHRVVPSVSNGGEWIYLEYAQGQFITSHVDYAIDMLTHPDGSLGHADAHVCGISLALTDDHSGGEFFVETSGASELWREDHPHLIADGADHTSVWFPRTECTRWTAHSAVGTALLYGSQVIHGTLPVSGGVAKKIVGFLKE